MIPADKQAIPGQYWFVNGKYYESKIEISGLLASKTFLSLIRPPDFEQEITDPYVIERIKAAFVKDQED